MFLFNLIFRGFNVRGHRDFQTDPITDDVKLVHKALLKESHRLGRNKVISLTIFMEHTDLDFTGIDIYAALAVLEASNKNMDVEEDSFGNRRFQLVDGNAWSKPSSPP